MKKSVLFIISLVALIILIAGCAPGKAPSKKSPFLGGAQGLQISFIPENPPKEVFDEADFKFDIVAKLENVGEQKIDAERAMVEISGIHPAEFGWGGREFKKSVPEEIIGVRKDSEGNKIPGGLTLVEFKDLYHRAKLTGNIEYPLVAEVCYPYKTKVNSQICLGRNLFRPGGGVCEVTGTKEVYNSGAPVQVTSLTESIAGREKVQFSFDIVHKGKGSVYDPRNGCNKGSFMDTNRIKVKVEPVVSEINIECKGLSEKISNSNKEGYVRLYDKQGVASVICMMDSRGVDAETPVNIELDYYYLDEVSTTLLVKHIVE